MFYAIANVQTAIAELPSLTTKEALGRFAISENNKYSFNIECKGRYELLPNGGRQKKVHKTSAIVIEPIIEEALPNGSFKARAVNYDSFESNDPATAELEKTTIRGQAAKDAITTIEAAIAGQPMKSAQAAQIANVLATGASLSGYQLGTRSQSNP